MALILRDYQVEAVKATFAAWRNSKSIPLIVAPTGSGKSSIIAAICKKLIDARPNYSILVLSHRKEIISQNAKAIYEMTGKPCGIYSAGLGMKTIRQVTCANIQSIYKKEITPNLIIIDEAHLVSGDEDSMYGKFLSRQTNTKICGLTATPFRLDAGNLIGGLFTEIAYEIAISELISRGYLAPTYSKPGRSADLDSVKMSGADYNLTDLELRYDIDELIQTHCADIAARGKDRKHWLIFCTGIKHTEDVCKEMKKHVSAEFITGEMSPIFRDLIINQFRTGKIRALVNCDILTTGFDFPGVDLIALLRATKSASLYMQMVGRGMRIERGKDSCLLLDYGENIKTHGPIDCIDIPRKSGERLILGITATQECQSCGAIVHANYLNCPICSGVLKLRPAKQLNDRASIAAVINEPETWDVTSISWKIHIKNQGPPMLRMVLRSGLREVSEFFCFEHKGYASQIAHQKWSKLGGKAVKSTDQAFNQTLSLPEISRVEVQKRGNFYGINKILSFKVDPKLEVNV